jgi:hypothetical protein
VPFVPRSLRFPVCEAVGSVAFISVRSDHGEVAKMHGQAAIDESLLEIEGLSPEQPGNRIPGLAEFGYSPRIRETSDSRHLHFKGLIP